jgi:integrase
LVGSSNLPAATITLRTSPTDQGTTQKLHASSHISSDQGIGLKQAAESFLLSCTVEGKSYGTIECYTDKLKGFLWYARNYHWPDNFSEITTNHVREFLAYLRESKHRFNSTCLRTLTPINNTTIQKYYRAFSVLFNWLINEGILEYNPLLKIKVPKAEKRVINALSQDELSKLLDTFDVTFRGKRNRGPFPSYSRIILPYSPRDSIHEFLSLTVVCVNGLVSHIAYARVFILLLGAILIYQTTNSLKEF